MKTLKEHIIEKYDALEKDTQFEVVEYILDKVKSVIIDERRWFYIKEHTVKVLIDNQHRYFQYEEYDPKGEDASPEDCGFEIPDLDDLIEVVPFERIVIDYQPL